MFTAEYGGFDLNEKKVKLRLEPRSATPGQPLRAEERETMPELEGIRFEEGRYGVIYSKYDLSCSLEGNPSAKCLGYDPDGAARIGVNIVLYSMSP